VVPVGLLHVMKNHVYTQCTLCKHETDLGKLVLNSTYTFETAKVQIPNKTHRDHNSHKFSLM